MGAKKSSFNKGVTFIIAELSANHQQNISVAVQSMKAAAKAGVDAVKAQTYTPDTMTIDVDNKYFQVDHPEWGGQTLYKLYQKASTPWDWFRVLKKEADKLGVCFFSTAFDKTAVDFLEDLNVPIHKIASFELVDLPLIEYMAKTRKPLIMSTGMATIEEIKEAVAVARKAGAKDLTLLKCVSNYPAKPENVHLRGLIALQKKFKCRVGISDHTLGIAVSVAAVSLGASVIEKHFTLSRQMKTPDSFFSLEPKEWKELVENVRVVEKALGEDRFGRTRDENAMSCYRRSLFVVQDVKKGEVFTEKNIRSIRPAYGLAPKYFKAVLGKKAKRSVKRGEPLRGSMIEGSLK
jgi:pseudaminic acid synthase